MGLCDRASKEPNFKWSCYINYYDWSQLKVMWKKTCIPSGKLQLRSLLHFKAAVCLIVHIAACSCKWAGWSASNSLPRAQQPPIHTAGTITLLWPDTSTTIWISPPTGSPFLFFSLQFRHNWMACIYRRTLLLVLKKHFIDSFNGTSQTLIREVGLCHFYMENTWVAHEMLRAV